MGNLFENCTHRYSFEYIYENCTNTTNQCGLIRNVASSIDVFHWLDVYISTTIFVISGILNFYCLFIALYTYYFLDNETRKHYVFVLSRFLSSILVIISLLVLESTLFSESLSPTFAYYAVAFSIYDFSMDTLFFSYIMISLITYFGVVHYNFYRRHVSLRSLYIILISMWTFSLAIAIPLGLYEAASNSQGPIKCDLSYCGKVVEWITFSIACISLAITASLTGFAVISLHWYNYKSKTNGVDVPKVTTRARIRLTWTFFALIVICLIELLPFGLVIGNDKSSLQGCDSFYNANELLVQSIISSVETLVGSLVFLTDPLINIFFDKNISKMVKLQLTLGKWFIALYRFLFQMTNIFENCSTHYSFEKNLQKCVNASNPCQLLQKMNTAHSLMIWMGFYIPSAMCFLAVLVDTYCLLVTISILKSLKKQSRKQYIFVVVRLSAAILIALCIIIIQSTYFIDIPFRDTFAFFAVLFIIYDFSILSLLGSFTGVAMMTYFGVMRPLVYRDKFTLKTIYIIAFAIVLFSVCVAIPFGLFQAADEIDGPIKCDSESCELIVKWLLFCIACLILMGCTGTLLFVTVSLHWHSYKSKKMGNVSSSAFNHGKSRLTWTTTILVILCCVELIPTGLLAAFGKSESISDDCYDFYNANSLIFPAIVSSLETFLGSITFLLDPIINFSFDKRISKVFSSQMKFLRSKVFCASSSSLSRNDKIIKDQSQIE